MTVQCVGIADIVSDHNVGTSKIVAHITLQIPAMKKEQVLGHEFSLFRHFEVFLVASVKLTVDEGKVISQRYTAIKDFLFFEEVLDCDQFIDVAGVQKCLVQIRFEGDKEHLHS